VNRAEKSAEIQDLREKFQRASGVIITEYRGLSVSAIQTIRNDFRKEQAEYRVVKNTLAIRAIADTPLESLKPYFDGPTAIAIAFGDPVAAAKIAAKSADDHQKLVLKVGYTDGSFFKEKDGIKQMSTMPSKDELKAQLLSTLLAGPQQFLQMLYAAPQNFLYLLDARKRQLEEQGEK
jgi:large subunit ribosomal protein L10